MTIMLLTCSLMTGANLDKSIGGAWSMAWLGLVILFFLFAFARRWLFEEVLQMPFNLWIGFGACFIVYFFTISFMCSPRFALVFGLLAGAAGGYFGGLMFDQGGGS